MRHLYPIILVLTTLFSLVAAGAWAQESDPGPLVAQEVSVHPEVARRLSEYLHTYQAFRVDRAALAARVRTDGRLDLVLGSLRLAFDVEPVEPLADCDTGLLEGEGFSRSAGPSAAFRGTSDDGSARAHGVASPTHFQVRVRGQGERLYVGVPMCPIAAEVGDLMADDLVLVYRGEDRIAEHFPQQCPVRRQRDGASAGRERRSRPVAVEGTVTAYLATDADIEFVDCYLGYTNDFIQSFLEEVEEIYAGQVTIDFQIGCQHQWDSTEPLSSYESSNLLQELKAAWNTTFQDVPRDAVLLFSGKSLNNKSLGRAAIGRMWDPEEAYALTGWPNDVETIAHELGHSLDASHDCDSFDVDDGNACNNCQQCEGKATGPIMCGCIQEGSTTFSEYSICAMENYIASECPTG